MVQGIKALAAKPKDLNRNPRIHTVGEDQFGRLTSNLRAWAKAEAHDYPCTLNTEMRTILISESLKPL